MGLLRIVMTTVTMNHHCHHRRHCQYYYPHEDTVDDEKIKWRSWLFASSMTTNTTLVPQRERSRIVMMLMNRK